jgi:bacterial/archaeal transporter family-2 protein
VGSTGAATTLALAAGVAGSLQIAILGVLGQRIGELEAAAFAFALTAVAGVVILLVARRSLAGFGDALGEPAWMWLGGLMGVFIVTAIVITGPRIGIVATSALLIAGQLASATVIDRFGWFGLDRVPLNGWRVAGLVLLTTGALLTLRR